MVEVQLPAYCKMVLHAIKYPHCATRGILLGHTKHIDHDQNPATEVTVVDAIPGFHNSLVTPQFEMLLIHLDSYCKEEKLKIVGVYFANQQVNDTGLDDVLGRMTLDKLQAPIMLQVENSKLSVNSNCSCLHAFVIDGKWKNKQCRVQNEEDTITTTSIAIQNRLYRDLADFENYLEQPSVCDFYNTDLNLKIETIL